jgi:hypothetical protein
MGNKQNPLGAEKEDLKNSQIPPPVVTEKEDLRKSPVPKLYFRSGTIERVESEAGMLSENALAEYSKVISKMNGGVGMK